MTPEDLSRIELKLAELSGKVDATFASIEKIRKYMMWTAIVTIGVIVLPLLAIPLVLPLLGSYLGTLTLPAGF